MFLKIILTVSLIIISLVTQASEDLRCIKGCHSRESGNPGDILANSIVKPTQHTLDSMFLWIPAFAGMTYTNLNPSTHNVNYSKYMHEKQKEDFLTWKAINSGTPYDINLPHDNIHLHRQEQFLHQMTKLNTQLTNKLNNKKTPLLPISLPLPLPFKIDGNSSEKEFSIPIFRSN